MVIPATRFGAGASFGVSGLYHPNRNCFFAKPGTGITMNMRGKLLPDQTINLLHYLRPH